MCSSPPRSAFAVLLAASAALACGHKAPPVPPARMIPVTTSTLKAHQRGTEVVLRFPYPTTTLRGAVLSGLAQVDIYQYSLELPADVLELQRQEIRDYRLRLQEYEKAMAALRPASVPGGVAGAATEEPVTEEPVSEEPASGAPASGAPALPDEAPGDAEDEAEGDEAEEGEPEAPRHPGAQPTLADLVQVDPRTFQQEATLVNSLAGAELDAAILGSDVVVRLPLAPLPAEGAAGHLFALQTRSPEGLASSFSNFARLVPLAPPPAPEGLTIEPGPDGVALAWTAAEDPPIGFKIYRREAQSRTYLDATASPVATARSYTDTGAVLEARYIYAVTTVAQAEPLVESGLSAERELYYQDRFPPAAPAEVAAFPDEGAVRVLWAPPSADDDVAGYIVYRRAEGGNAQALMEEPVAGLEYVDGEAPAGSVLLYAVVAVDGHGNRSDASAEVRVRVP